MKKVKCEICGEYVPQSDMSKSYRHRCKKCVAELTRQSRHDAKMRLAATEESDTHTAVPATPYGILYRIFFSNCAQMVLTKPSGLPFRHTARMPKR